MSPPPPPPPCRHPHTTTGDLCDANAAKLQTGTRCRSSTLRLGQTALLIFFVAEKIDDKHVHVISNSRNEFARSVYGFSFSANVMPHEVRGHYSVYLIYSETKHEIVTQAAGTHCVSAINTEEVNIIQSFDFSEAEREY